MRIPLSEVYRAFPELDPFSAARCREFVDRARRRHRVSQAVFGAVALICTVGVWVIVGLFWARTTGAFGPHSYQRPTVAVIALGSTMLSGAVAGLLVRDRWLRWAVSEQIDATRCPQCRYALLGLPVSDDAVTCPECGHRHWLPELDLSAARILGEGD